MNCELRIKKIIIILLLLLAAFLRLYRLGDYPALNADEAAIGYNAYSLLETGLDEHGNHWPIHFQSFNDYKPGLYFYLVLPFVEFMGLSVWAVRIPGAMLGVGTVLAVYLLVKELFVDKKLLALTSAFFLAISPWHIHFSRGGWEVNVATFFITLGVWLYIKSANNKFTLKPLLLSTTFFVLGLYTYHAARVVVPLLALGLFFNLRDCGKDNFKKVVLTALIGGIFLIPLGLDLVKGSVFSRAAGVGLFADKGVVERINEQRMEHQAVGRSGARVMHNKLVNYSLAFVENWASHFQGEFLFLSGDDIQRNKVPGTGQMYLFEAVFLIAGLVMIARDIKRWKVILLWLFVAPLAAALTFQSPHALRAQNMVIPLTIISAYGLVSLSFWVCSKIHKKMILDGIFLLFIAMMAWSFARYLTSYWYQMSVEYPFSSQYGVEKLVDYIENNGDVYDKIIVTDRYDQPYILFLFYLKYPPEKFQADHELTVADEYGFSTVRSFDKYEFRSIDFGSDISENPNSLLIGTDKEIPNGANVIKEIYGTNGYLYFQAAIF